MWIEPIFNQLGAPLTFGLTVALLALPMALVGGWLRGRGRRERTRWELCGAAETPLRAISPGRVTVVGTWRNLGPGRGVVEEGEECVVVERQDDSAAPSDGTRALVAGYATRQVDNPQGGSYRGKNRVWVIEGDGLSDPVLVSGDPAHPSRALRAARMRSLIGAAMLGVSVAVTVGAAALCYRAASEEYGDYGDDPGQAAAYSR